MSGIAHEIATRGWTTGTYLSEEDGSVCLVGAAASVEAVNRADFDALCGAIHSAGSKHPAHRALIAAIEEYTGKTCFDITLWNDNATAEEALLIAKHADERLGRAVRRVVRISDARQVSTSHDGWVSIRDGGEETVLEFASDFEAMDFAMNVLDARCSRQNLQDAEMGRVYTPLQTIKTQARLPHAFQCSSLQAWGGKCDCILSRTGA